jgi:hypothetical protein
VGGLGEGHEEGGVEEDDPERGDAADGFERAIRRGDEGLFGHKLKVESWKVKRKDDVRPRF